MADPFLARWSRLKRAEASADRAPDEFPETAGAAQRCTTDEDVAPTLSDADMPPLDTLDDRSDVSMFFARGVSEALRRQALRKVFSGPAFNVRCPLDEYAEDYSMPEKLGATAAAGLRRWAQEEGSEAMGQARDWLERHLAGATRSGSAVAPGAAMSGPAPLPAAEPGTEALASPHDSNREPLHVRSHAS